MDTDEELLAQFLRIGLVETTAKNALKNRKFCCALKAVIDEADVATGCPKQMGSLLYSLAAKCPTKALQHRQTVAVCIKEEKIKSNAQLDGALDYLKSLGDSDFESTKFEQFAGIGVKISEEDIKNAIEALIESEKDRLLSDRYLVNMNQMMGRVIQTLKFADGPSVKTLFDAAILTLLGPKTEADLKAVPEKKKKQKAPKAKDEASVSTKPQAENGEVGEADADPFAFFAKPDENHQVHTTVHFSSGDQMHISNSDEQLRAHLTATGGKFMTRFPPEPNGYLHIGHAKAMFIDFGLAERYGGHCYLRYDDTNPEAEKLEYITHIQEIVAWMGWKPWKVTYSSDYFDQLYDLAVRMIQSGHAYVCHQTGDEIKEYRKEMKPSPWRDRPVSESLQLFDDMKRGLIDEGEATLRMKQDPQNENPNMWDLIAYRVKFTKHPHIGDKWCIYPSYDFTHCVVDALENISHSLCTLEFEVRRVSYYWLLEVLGLYKPVEFEYSRLTITYNVLSKRKLKALVMGGYVRGWDDPRLYTLAGLRRRGVTPAAMNSFCREMGITRSDNAIPVHRFEHHIRQDLDMTSPRTMAVLKPLKIIITNLNESHFEMVPAKRFPGRTEDVYELPFARVVFIEETDFKEQDEKGYFGLAPGKSVMLRYAYPITCHSVAKDAETGKILHLECTYDAEFRTSEKKPPKGVLNWVCQPPEPAAAQPVVMEARLYGLLFTCEMPGDTADESWLDMTNPESEVIVKGALGNHHLRDSTVGDRFQFERLGYFCLDPDSTAECLVVNRTVTLRDSLPKSLKS